MWSSLHILRRQVVVHRPATRFRIGLRHLRRISRLDDAHSGTLSVRYWRCGRNERGGRHRVILRRFKEAPGADGVALDDLWHRIGDRTSYWGCHNG